MSMEYQDHPFWDFSLSVYGKPGVSHACIAVQDRHIIDVNFLLLSLWHGHSGKGRISVAAMEKANALFLPWNQEIVCALRAIRERLKDGFDGIPEDHLKGMRESVLSLEIECEHIEHLAMVEAIDADSVSPSTTDEGARLEDTISNFKRYFSLREVKAGEDDIADLLTILAAGFDGITEQDIETRLRKTLLP